MPKTISYSNKIACLMLNGLNKKIKQARLQKGLTQTEFAKEIGVQRTAVYLWEKKDTPNYPSIHNLLAIAFLCGLNLDYFFGRDKFEL